ncbi:MAG: hypothetical protein GXO93_01985, partial [FCB group bacterium]|nr:hypothetical protein [FCB group bacterium]
ASSAVDSEIVTITVNDAGNQPPVLNPIGAQSTTENVLLSFGVSATDPDGTIPTLTTSTLPTGATFTDNTDGTGTFDWTPDFTQAGTYNVTFYAGDGVDTDSEIVTITVADAGNQPPVLNPIGAQSTTENVLLSFGVSATDPDGAVIPLLTTSTLPLGANFVDSGNGAGSFNWLPEYTQAGVYSVTFYASDTVFIDSEVVTITVNNNNRSPILDSIGAKSVVENKLLTFNIMASDSDGTVPLLSTSLLPTGATFTDSGNGTGNFWWVPQYSQAGVYLVTFYASDTINVDSEVVTITVVTANIPPVLDSIGPKTVMEGDTLIVNITASDPDGPPPAILAENMPDNSSFTDNGDGTAQFIFTPNYIQSGLASVTFKAFDGIDIDKEIVLIQVYEAGNQTPVFDSIPSPVVMEGDTLDGIITAHDPDTLPVTIFLDTTSNIPQNFVFVDSGGGVASYHFTPSYVQSGTYNVGIVVSDGFLNDTTIVTFTVTEAGNQTPVLNPIADTSVMELHNLNFTVSAYDLDLNTPVLTASPLPGAATFVDNNDGTGTFNWTPGGFDAGVYGITFYALDSLDALLYDSQFVTITVADTNRPPIYYTPLDGADINEGDTLYFLIYAQDPDSTIPSIEAFLDGTDSLATNMTFVDSGNGVGVLTFMPDFFQGDYPTPSFYNLRFLIRDAVDTSLITLSQIRTIKVYDVNQPPTMIFSKGTGPFTILEGDTLSFNVGTIDPDSGTISDFRAENLPVNATFVGSVNAKVFTFIPDYTQSGQYFVSFISVDDKLAADTQIVEIDVTEAGNQPPVFTTTLADTTDVYVSIGAEILVTASDPEMGPLAITASPVLATATFVDSGNGSAVYTYNPDSTEVNNITQVTFIVTDSLLASDTMITNLRVRSFQRGDLDYNNKYTMNDIVYIANYMFRNGPDPTPLTVGDVDGSGTINIADIAYLVNYMYKAGPRPPQ